ncbi:MAG TPA: dienelactone hydrolase family protein [Candidatus Angelobacter sp.]|nr:dienelactone hydrolase family protein [Candidatus Angelobacter sp.]
MRKLVLLFLLALSSTIVLAAAKPEKQTLTSQGTSRTYYTFVPEKLAAPAPLLLLLHGSGRDGMSQIDEWKTLAEKERIILAAPDSANSREWSMNTDGPEFLHDVVEAVRAKNSVDGKRIYIFGHSAGAVFALYMGVMESRYFAAAGVHAGAMGEDFYPYIDLAKRKIPITIWVGTEDPYFKMPVVKATQAELNKHGFDAQVVEMKGHDHNFYAVAKDLNPQIWEFFRNHPLDEEANWQVYQRK